MTPEPFTLHVPDEVLDDLRVRLERTRWPDEVADAGLVERTCSMHGEVLAAARDDLGVEPSGDSVAR